MNLRLSEVPTLTAPPAMARESAKRRLTGAPRAWNRRALLQGAISIGTGVGLSVVGLLPPARTARADGYDILNRCPRPNNHDCEPGCAPSKLCWDCCRYTGGTRCTDPAWFKNNGNYRIRKADCWPGHRHWDGWLWKYNRTCGCCRGGVTYRCHDGKKKIRGRWYKRICRSTTACNCHC